MMRNLSGGSALARVAAALVAVSPALVAVSPALVAVSALIAVSPALIAVSPALAQHGDEAEHGDAADHEGDEHDGVAHGDEAGHEGEHELGAVHEPVWDYGLLGYQLLNFFVWAGLLIWVIRSRIPGFLAGRKAALVEGLEEARRMKDEAERKVEEYTSRIDNLDAELDKMRAQMRDGGLAERDRIVKDAASRAEKMRAEAKFLIEQQMKSLREDLTREAIEAAIGAAEKILRDKVGAPGDQERLATEYLGHLERQLQSAKPSAAQRSALPNASGAGKETR